MITVILMALLSLRRETSSARRRLSASAPAACALRLFAQFFVEDDEELLTKGANMSHTPLSQEETCKHDLSKEDRKNVLAFPLGNARATERSPSKSVLDPEDAVERNVTKLVPAPGAIKTRYLHDVDNDTTTYPHPGPNVLASITGEPVSVIRNAIRQVRYGSKWLDFERAPPIKRTHGSEIEEALRLFGYVGSWRQLPDRPTLAAYLKSRSGAERDHPCIVFLSTHCVALSGGVFCDVLSGGVVIDIDEAKGRRKRVSRVFVLTERITPSPIASRQAASKATKMGAGSEIGLLFRKAIKAETGAKGIKITPNEVFITHPDHRGWYWLGGLDSVEAQILQPYTGGPIRGETAEAAAYRKAMGF